MLSETTSSPLKDFLIDVLGIRTFLSDHEVKPSSRPLRDESTPSLSVYVDFDERNANSTLFSKIISAMKLPDNTLKVVTSVDELRGNGYVLRFGRPPDSKGWPRGTWRSGDGVQEMWTHSLLELSKSQVFKKETWTDMKRVIATVSRASDRGSE